MEDNTCSWKMKTPVMPHQHHPAALIFAASRWEFGIIEFCEARRTSYPAHFVISSQMDVISPILGMNGSSCDARVLLCILCTAQRLVFAIQRVTHLCPGSWPRFYEGMLHQSSIHIPQEVRHRILNQRCALSQIHGRVKLLWKSNLFYFISFNFTLYFSGRWRCLKSILQ